MGSSSNCTQCAANFYRNSSLGFNCVKAAQCPAGTFANDLDATCTPCSEGCHTCSGPARSACTQCFPNYFAVTSPFDCVEAEDCPMNTYANTTLKLCKNCPTGCASCSGDISATDCTTCDANFFRVPTSKECVSASNCPLNTYAYSANQTCHACPTGCSRCTGLNAPSDCTTCAVGYYRLPSSQACVLPKDCPAKSYANPANSACTYCSGNTFLKQATDTSCTTCDVSVR